MKDRVEIVTRKDGISRGMCFQQKNGPASIWEVDRIFEAIDGRRYAVLRRIDNPSDQKTLALQGLQDGGLFRRVFPSAQPEPHGAAGAE